MAPEPNARISAAADGLRPGTAYVFDMDGVLVDSERPMLALLGRLLSNHGVHVEPSELRQVCGRPGRFLGTFLAPRLGDDARLADLLAQYADGKKRLVAARRFRAFDGAARLLVYLRGHGIRLAVATSTCAEHAIDRLRQAGLRSWFDHIVTGDDVVSGKPAPDIFLLAARRLGVAEDSCVVVEDSLAGVQAARNAGMTVFAVATTFDADELAAADRVFGTLNDLHAFLRGAHGDGPARGGA